MKKIMLLAFIIASLFTTASFAQDGNRDPETMKQRMKERIKPQLIEKTKITNEQADKVIDINFDIQRQRRELRLDATLSDDDKKKKAEALDAEIAKKYKAIPLTDEEVKNVTTFFDEMRKNMSQRRPDNK